MIDRCNGPRPVRRRLRWLAVAAVLFALVRAERTTGAEEDGRLQRVAVRIPTQQHDHRALGLVDSEEDRRCGEDRYDAAEDRGDGLDGEHELPLW